MGLEVTIVSTSPSKEAEARRMGATNFIVSSEATLKEHARTFDHVFNTAGAKMDYHAYIGLCKPYGNFVVMGYDSVGLVHRCCMQAWLVPCHRQTCIYAGHDIDLIVDSICCFVSCSCSCSCSCSFVFMC
jgi:D-arabinose 1-dehydrogenase-like Zn-dependent alcohol dehydrogenase